VRRLEAKLGVRLLNRTTRSVVPTEAGRSLLARLGPVLNEVDSALDVINGFRDTPTGTLRLNVPMSAARLVLPAIVPRFLAAYPEIRLEVTADETFVDVLAAGCDAGIRYEERLEQDMIAVPIGPDLRMVVIASPDYIARQGAPATPHDLADHACINYRLPTLGGLYAWEFEKDGQATNVRVAGRLIFNSMALVQRAVLAGMGLAVMMHDEVAPLIAEGRLVTVLDDWTPPFSGYHLYYPSRRQPTPAFALLVDALRYRSR